MSEIPDNVTYIDEFKRERWLLRLRVARESGEVATFGALQDQDAQIIPLRPEQTDEPDGAA